MENIILFVKENWPEIITYALNIIVYILIALYGKQFVQKTTLLKGIVKDSLDLTVKRVEDLQVKNDNSLAEAKAYYEKAIKVAQKCEDMLHRIEQFTEFLCKEVYTDAGSDASDDRNDQGRSEDS